MESAELDIAKVVGDPKAYWRKENEAIPSSTMEFGKVTLKAKTLAALVAVRPRYSAISYRIISRWKYAGRMRRTDIDEY